jgi:hypothetical protein
MVSSSITNAILLAFTMLILLCGGLTEGKKTQKRALKKGGGNKRRITGCIGAYGDNTVKGKILIKFRKRDSMMNVKVKVRKAEPECVDCLVSVNDGVDCETPGIHYYNETAVTDDPWTVASGTTYTTNAIGRAKPKDSKFKVTNGFDHLENVGKPILVYNSTGDAIGCGILSTERKCPKPTKLH